MNIKIATCILLAILISCKNHVKIQNKQEKNIRDSITITGKSSEQMNSSNMKSPVDFFTEIEAEFPGGEDSLNSVINKYLNKPKNLSGKKILVELNIDMEGKISSFEIKPECPKCYISVKNLIEKMPRFKPAYLVRTSGKDKKLTNGNYNLFIDF